MTREEIYREVLEEIAAKGIVVHNAAAGIHAFDARDRCRCLVCNHTQQSEGVCLNRECLATVARRGLEDGRAAT